MAGKCLALGVLLVLVLTAFSGEPQCPQIRCGGGNKVACFIGEDRCQCSCVSDQDPCTSLMNISCPEAHTLRCSSQDIFCVCRCVLK